MDERELSHMLKEMAERAFPTEVNLWPRLRARIEASSQPAGIRRWIRQPLAWGLVALLLALGVGVGVWAGNLWERFTLARGPASAELLTPIGLQQERDGYRITLEWAYADWNAIFIGYRIQGPSQANERLEIPRIRLIDDAGHVFQPEAEEGLIGTSTLMGLTLPAGEQVSIVAFDAWEGFPLPDTLRLQATFQLNVIPISGSEESLQRIPPGAGRTIGPFTFTFAVPVHPGDRLATPQTAVANEVRVTMEQLIVTPSSTKARLCITSPDPQRSWDLVPQLTLGPHTTYGGGTRPDGEGCFRVFFPIGSTNLRQRTGSLQIRELIGWDPERPTESVRLPGPWIFPLTP
ncbi:MAG TPA: hypothetical protein VNK89_04025 [Thermoflexus sp.]|nr:hypothetical protein [Thermoflexus sp.]